MAYTAHQIASVVIHLYEEKGKEITNLKLQQVLYYIQAASLKKFGKPAFEDDIETWRFGASVRDLYNDFCCYIGSPISISDPVVAKNYIHVNDDLFQCIKVIAEKSFKYSAWELADLVKETIPWKETLRANIIGKEEIKSIDKLNLV